MSKRRRLILWANDSPLAAVDSVCDSITKELESYLNDAEEDSCFINDVVAYVRCLTGVYDWAGGPLVEINVLDSWQNRAIAVLEKMPDSLFKDEGKRAADIEFVKQVFDDLRTIVLR
ncbi:MAG: hypothetical protein ACR2NP_04555 [Pirellulaceae bacterium]